MNFPIDFVIDWVDGADPVWLSNRAIYQKEKNKDAVRFRDWGLLPYWFRSVEKNAPWVNKIYLITADQKPNWLNLSNSKIQLVSHHDYIPSKYLPVFNSNAIELPIGNITQLSEHFVFFNDDFFLNKEVKPEMFFSEDGMPRDSGVLSPQIPVDNSITSITTNNTKIINNHFSRSDILHQLTKFLRPNYGRQNVKTIVSLAWPIILGFHDFHLPISFLKSTFSEVWELEENRLEKTLDHRFRSESDYNIFLFRYFQLLTGKFSPRSVNFGKYYDLSDNNDIIISDIKKSKHAAIVLNDQEVSDFDSVKNELINVFQTKYPKKSKFEV